MKGAEFIKMNLGYFFPEKSTVTNERSTTAPSMEEEQTPLYSNLTSASVGRSLYMEPLDQGNLGGFSSTKLEIRSKPRILRSKSVNNFSVSRVHSVASSGRSQSKVINWFGGPDEHFQIEIKRKQEPDLLPKKYLELMKQKTNKTEDFLSHVFPLEEKQKESKETENISTNDVNNETEPSRNGFIRYRNGLQHHSRSSHFEEIYKHVESTLESTMSPMRREIERNNREKSMGRVQDWDVFRSRNLEDIKDQEVPRDNYSSSNGRIQNDLCNNFEKKTNYKVSLKFIHAKQTEELSNKS